MRILVTCDRYPSPRHEGLVLRIYHYVRHLSSRHQFDLLCLERPGQLRDNELESFFGKVVCLPFPERPKRGRLGSLMAAFDVDDLYVHSEFIRSAVHQVVNDGRYDLVWDAGCNMLLNLGSARKSLPLLADQVDDAFLGLRRQLDLKTGFRRKIWLLKQLMLQKKFAKRHLASAEAVLFVSSLDEDSFREVCPDARTVTIANGVDETYFSPTLEEPAGFLGRPEVVFEGVMCFPPNVDAAHYFVREIFPLLKTRIHDVHFSLVGRDPVPDLVNLRSKDVEVTGFVDDVRPWLENAHIFVCPMRSGAGIKNKILQAWAMGKAVVSTPEGAHGLDARNGENIVICSTPDAFSGAVADLLENPEMRRKLGAHARNTIEQGFSWTSKSLELEKLFENIVMCRT